MVKRIFMGVEYYLSWLWQITKSNRRLLFPHWFVFNVLCFFELFYLLFFYINSLLRRLRGGKRVAGLKIISIGNLSVGGTGKSVVTAFLCKTLGCNHCAVVMRGYGRHQWHSKGTICCRGNSVGGHNDDGGDEARMLAQQLNIPVVINSDRFLACQYIAEHFRNVSYVILDDAYQNYRMKKDVEILLLDARYPLENHHCLPAGRLREKDCTRADLIFLTHAQSCVPEEIHQIKTVLLRDIDPQKILTTRHRVIEIFDSFGITQKKDILSRKRVVMVAGIGEPTNFVETIRVLGAEIDDVVIFRDHYDYQQGDVKKIIKHATNLSVDAIVTTEKDWVKIKPLIGDFNNFMWYVPRVSIEFLSQEEYSSFELFLKRSLKIE